MADSGEKSASPTAPLGLQFGQVIAFLLPGLIFLFGTGATLPKVDQIVSAAGRADASIGSVLSLVLAALAAGLLLSALRWLILDRMIYKINLRTWRIDEPNWNFAAISDPNKYAAFLGVVENHYNFYQYFSNTLIAILGSVAVRELNVTNVQLDRSTLIIVAVLSIALLLAARDALSKFYRRAEKILN